MACADPVMRARQPRFEIGEDEMADGQEFFGDFGIAAFGDGDVCRTPRLWGHLQIRRETVREPDVDQERDLMVVCAGTGAARLPPPEAWPVPVA